MSQNIYRLKNFIQISGFVLIAIGTIGLLFNEFIWHGCTSSTIILAIVNLVGLTNLAFAHFGMKNN
ncbi:MAG: hypothetical protein PHQ86_02590 [Dehalococcoidales bacterium]|nr:hypothetical protein [Dehalococcoidales bacterium]